MHILNVKYFQHGLIEQERRRIKLKLSIQINIQDMNIEAIILPAFINYLLLITI